MLWCATVFRITNLCFCSWALRFNKNQNSGHKSQLQLRGMPCKFMLVTPLMITLPLPPKKKTPHTFHNSQGMASLWLYFTLSFVGDTGEQSCSAWVHCSLLTSVSDHSLLWGGGWRESREGCSVHCRIFSSIPAPTPVVTTKNISRCGQKVPREPRLIPPSPLLNTSLC